MPKPAFVAGSDTSMFAAHTLKTRERVARYWLEMAAEPMGVTISEIKLRYGLDHNTASPRQTELHRGVGVLVDSGLRRKTSSGKPATVFKLAEGYTVDSAFSEFLTWCKSAKNQRKPKISAETAETSNVGVRRPAEVALVNAAKVYARAYHRGGRQLTEMNDLLQIARSISYKTV